MTGPFNVGDVVVCVDAGRREGHANAPIPGILKLRGLYRIWRTTLIGSVAGVQVEGDPNNLLDDNGWWHADRFRPLKPATQQFTAQIRAIKPIRKQVDA